MRHQGLTFLNIKLHHITLGLSSEEEERLLSNIFRGYNPLVRPAPNISSVPIEISFGLALELLINVVCLIKINFIK